MILCHRLHRNLSSRCHGSILPRRHRTGLHSDITTGRHHSIAFRRNLTLIYSGYRFTAAIGTVPYNLTIAGFILNTVIDNITIGRYDKLSCFIGLLNRTALIYDIILSIYSCMVTAFYRALCITNIGIRHHCCCTTFNQSVIIMYRITMYSYRIIRHYATAIMHRTDLQINRLSLHIRSPLNTLCGRRQI